MITYLRGDATAPQSPGPNPKLILHICNDIGVWGAGFVLAVSRRWLEPELYYRRWHSGEPIQIHEPGKIVMTTGRFEGGQTQFVLVQRGLVVVNMIAQSGVGMRQGPPIRYEWLEKTLEGANQYAQSLNASIHMPRIGTGLGGGSWSKVEPLIEKTIQVPVFVYDYP